MFQDFANTLEGAEVEVYILVYPSFFFQTFYCDFSYSWKFFKEMMFYQVVGRKVQEEGETINHDIGEEEMETNHIFFIHQKQ